MYNAAIVIFRRSTLPRILKFFAAPGIDKVVEIGDAGHKIKVYIIECPVMNIPADNRKIARALKSLFLENDISFFIGRNTGLYFDSGLDNLENSIERSSTDEVRAIKALAALIRLSGSRNTNLLKSNMCFIGESCSFRYIGTLAEEATGIFIYEHDGMDASRKKDMFESLMAEKGISAVFTRDIGRAVAQCDIVAADAGADLEAYTDELKGKILIGDNAAAGDFEKVGRVLLWYERLEGLAKDNAIISFNDEMLEILRHFYREKSLAAFMRRVPYINVSK